MSKSNNTLSKADKKRLKDQRKQRKNGRGKHWQAMAA